MKYIVANWKMHKTQKQSLAFVKQILPRIKTKRTIVLCPPYTDICPIAPLLKKTNIRLGAQDVFYETRGAFTGEISPLMLKELNVKYVLIGHSERRSILHENNRLINQKLRACLKHSLTPILCIGETGLQRRLGQASHVLRNQLLTALKGTHKLKNIIIAYEPLWAIGSHTPDTPENAEKTNEFIRSVLAKSSSAATAKKIPILYGGSVTPRNAPSFLKKAAIDGLLVGHESLFPGHFVKIVNCAP